MIHLHENDNAPKALRDKASEYLKTVAQENPKEYGGARRTITR